MAEVLAAVRGQHPPGPFGLAIITAEGEEFAFGHHQDRFPIQAAANPFTYGIACRMHGPERVHERLGMEPSGNPFDAVLLNPQTNRPYNPLNNAGAIAVASLLTPATRAPGSAEVLDHLAEFAGQPLAVDLETLAAEEQHGDHNRAIAHLLRSLGVIEDVDAALFTYFEQCSVTVDCLSLARMGATLACWGTHPTTGQEVLTPEQARAVLAIMYTCGMHDRSGDFAFEVGIPAKSGISGGIVGCVPGLLGIAVYSPGVNEAGSSIGGLALMKQLAARLGWGLFTDFRPR